RSSRTSRPAACGKRASGCGRADFDRPDSEMTDSTSVIDRFRVNGRVALVTGGGRGLGEMMATALAQAGADGAVTSRGPDSTAPTAEAIAAATGRRVRPFALEVTNANAIQPAVAEIEAALGPIDILINNAGVNIRGAVTDLTEADWDAVLDTNLKG